MNWFRKLPGHRRAPAGLEWQIWRRLPAIFLGGTLVPLAILGALWWRLPAQPDAMTQRAFDHALGIVVGLVSLHWSLTVAVAIGCFIVRVMKGPAYVADAYPMEANDDDVDRRSRAAARL